jgi:hypothetical protein
MGISILGIDDSYYKLPMHYFGSLNHLSKIKEFVCNTMNGGVKVYTITYMDCIDNTMNMTIIQLKKNQCI